MAGSLAIVPTNTTESQSPSPISAIIGKWQVKYARFVNYSSIDVPSTHPTLSHLPPKYQKRQRGGAWISTSAASASLKLVFQPSSAGSDDAVLVVSLFSRIIEEHRVSKMHFSWPQVSCVTGFPPRGSTAVFVSYKNNLRQIQKFAIRFEAASETEKFMNILKEILKNGSAQQLQLSQMHSEISSQAEVVPTDGPSYRTYAEQEYSISPDSHSQPIIPTLELDEAREIISLEKAQDPEAASSMTAFPPSFSQLLMNCHPPAEEAAKQMTSGRDLKTQFVQYLQDTSFKDLLATVENVINELGDDLML